MWRVGLLLLLLLLLDLLLQVVGHLGRWLLLIVVLPWTSVVGAFVVISKDARHVNRLLRRRILRVPSVLAVVSLLLLLLLQLELLIVGSRLDVDAVGPVHHGGGATVLHGVAGVHPAVGVAPVAVLDEVLATSKGLLLLTLSSVVRLSHLPLVPTSVSLLTTSLSGFSRLKEDKGIILVIET